jgi:hypothetical protein
MKRGLLVKAVAAEGVAVLEAADAALMEVADADAAAPGVAAVADGTNV